MIEDTKRYRKGKTIAVIECPVCFDIFEREYRNVYVNIPEKSISVCCRECTGAVSQKGLNEIKEMAKGSIKTVYTEKVPVEYNDGVDLFRGRKVNYSNKYPRVYWPEHPTAQADGLVYIHRIVGYEKFGDKIFNAKYEIDHDNEDKLDWTLSNLILRTISEHRRKHFCDPVERQCQFCGESLTITKKRRKERKNVFCNRDCFEKHSAEERTKINWPDVELVLKLVVDTSFIEAGRQLGVSDNAVRKRLQNHMGWCPSAKEAKFIKDYENKAH